MLCFVNPRILVSNDNTLVYRSSEYIQATRHFVELDNARIQENMKDLKRQLRFVYVGRELVRINIINCSINTSSSLS